MPGKKKYCCKENNIIKKKRSNHEVKSFISEHNKMLSKLILIFLNLLKILKNKK